MQPSRQYERADGICHFGRVYGDAEQPVLELATEMCLAITQTTRAMQAYSAKHLGQARMAQRATRRP